MTEPLRNRSVQPFRLLSLAGALLLFTVGCKTSFPTYDVQESFGRSSITKDSLYQLVNTVPPQQALFPLYAKGKINVRSKNQSERGSVELYAYSDSLYAKVKNQVGIAGLEVWIIDNQLILNDRVENKVYHYTKQNVPNPLIKSLANIPLAKLLQPSQTWEKRDMRNIEDNRSYIRFSLRDQRYVLLDKETGQILRIDDLKQTHFPFHRIEYQLYRSYKDGYLPRRFRIFQPNTQTDIFLLLQQLRPIEPGSDAVNQWPVQTPLNQ